MRKVLLICAHPDDEAYGLGATLSYMISTKQWDVSLITFTDGVNSTEDGYTFLSSCLKNSCKQLGIKDHVQFGFHDQKLDTYSLTVLISNIDNTINVKQPALVITHNSTDLNLDHRIIFEATMVACRPKPGFSVQEVWSYEIPSSTNWGFGEFGNFAPNIFVPAISRAVENKEKAINCYPNELEEAPHARSIKAITSLCECRGSTVGFEYAEAFKLIRKIF